MFDGAGVVDFDEVDCAGGCWGDDVCVGLACALGGAGSSNNLSRNLKSELTRCVPICQIGGCGGLSSPAPQDAGSVRPAGSPLRLASRGMPDRLPEGAHRVG